MASYVRILIIKQSIANKYVAWRFVVVGFYK